MGIESTVALAELLRKHADDKPRSAIPALRPATLGHGALRVAKLSRFREGFNGVNLASGRCGNGNQATVDRTINGGMPGGTDGRSDKQDRAGPAFALGTAFFGSGESAPAKVIEKRDLRCYGIVPDKLSVQQKLKACRGGPHAEYYRIRIRFAPAVPYRKLTRSLSQNDCGRRFSYTGSISFVLRFLQDPFYSNPGPVCLARHAFPGERYHPVADHLYLKFISGDYRETR
jgi:hypothetical protein